MAAPAMHLSCTPRTAEKCTATEPQEIHPPQQWPKTINPAPDSDDYNTFVDFFGIADATSHDRPGRLRRLRSSRLADDPGHDFASSVRPHRRRYLGMSAELVCRTARCVRVCVRVGRYVSCGCVICAVSNAYRMICHHLTGFVLLTPSAVALGAMPSGAWRAAFRCSWRCSWRDAPDRSCLLRRRGRCQQDGFARSSA